MKQPSTADRKKWAAMLFVAVIANLIPRLAISAEFAFIEPVSPQGSTDCETMCDDSPILAQVSDTQSSGLSDWRFDVGGYVKLDTIFDFDDIGSTDFFAANQINTDGTDGQNFRMHARQTRLNLDARHQVNGDEVKLFVEGDFYGSGNAFRLRHGYLQSRGWLIGQTWTTFMDELAMPDLINFESPIGELTTRRAVARWTHHVEAIEGMTWSIAVEDPAPAFQHPTGQFENALPDFVMRTRTVRDQGHFQLAGFVTAASFEPTAGADSEAVAWGAAVSGRRKVWNNNALTAQASIGEGYERFRGFQSYDLNAAGDLIAVPAYAFFLGYEHHWSTTLKSVLAYSYVETDAENNASEIAKSVDYLACNLLWKPNDRYRCGIEYLYGSRGEYDGDTGDAHRIQMGFWYYLP